MTATQPDGTIYPWAEDLDGVWHRRPADDEWGGRDDETQARGLCGASFGSVHVSTFQPDLDGSESVLCSTCSTTLSRKGDRP